MANTRISPDERITEIALTSADPFARPGQKPASVPKQNVPKSNRDLSRFDEVPTVSTKKPTTPVTKKVEIKESTRQDVPKNAKPLKAVKPAPVPQEPKFVNPISESRSQEGIPSYRCEFSGRDIMLGCCFHKGPHNGLTFQACMALALDFGKDKFRFEMCLGDAKIGRARNRLAAKFLETDARYLLMLDDDIVPCIGRPNWMRYWVPPSRSKSDQVLQRHVAHRLIGSGKTMVAGAYFGRQENAALMCSNQDLSQRVKDSDDAVVPVDWVAAGCVLVHRQVFVDIRKKFGDSLKINVPDYDYDYFRELDGERGEDVSFCVRAKEAGHQPHVDLGIPVYHVGYKIYG